MPNREKEIWIEGHFVGLICATVASMVDDGVVGADNDSFRDAVKIAIRNAPNTLGTKTTDAMYDLWKSERYERLVEEYLDEQGLEATTGEDS